MDKAFVHFKAQNESKNVFKSTRTAGVYCAIVAIMYFLSSIFGFTGLYLLANICNFIMCICILTLMLLAYIRYSGNYDTIGIAIDEVANVLWNNLIKPVYQQVVEKSVSVAVAQAAEMATNTTMNATVTANGKPKLT